MTATERLVDHCRSISHANLDAETLDRTKKLVLDTLGTAVGGRAWSDSADVFLGAARALNGGGDPATVLGTGERLGAPAAALANGALSHSLDYDNRHSAGSLHVGSSVVTATLAAAERHGADGETVLEAVIAGYDVACRLGRACNPRSSHERGFHPTGTCGVFGATSAVSLVAGLDRAASLAAMGACGSLASGSYQCSLTGGWNKRLHPGLAARNAFLAVDLARSGFQGPDAPLEGELGFLNAYADDPVPERLTADLGHVYEVDHTKIKPYPLGTFTHAPIAILVDLVDEAAIAPSEVERVTVELPTSGAAFFGRDEGAAHPTTSAEAQFDMPFAAALAICAGEAGLEAFHRALGGEFGDTFDRLMASTTTVASDDLEAQLPERYPARVTVELADATYERSRDTVKGEPDRPMSWAELVGKFEDLAGDMPADRRLAAVDATRAIESVGIDDLMAPFRRP